MRTITVGILCLQYDSALPKDNKGAGSPMEIDGVIAEINDCLRSAMPDRQPQLTRHMVYPAEVVVSDMI